MHHVRRSGFALLLLLCACRRAEDVRRPVPDPTATYVLLISADTLRADHLNCYGYYMRTVSPNIDALARDGIVFENFISASPWTIPAHMSLMTSLYPSSHGVVSSFQELRSKMKEGDSFNTLPAARRTLAEVLRDNGFTTAAFTGGGTMDARLGFDQGFDEYYETIYKLREHNMEPMLDWIDRNCGAPFFLFWHSFEVHAPYLRTDFLPDVLPADQAATLTRELALIDSKLPSVHPQLDEELGVILSLPQVLERYNAFNVDVTKALYDGGILHLDRWVGRVVARLKELGIYDQTLIIFTSDHGEEFADRSAERFYDRHGHSAYREIVRVPLIIKLPDQRRAGRRVADVVRMIDVMPTVFDLIGIDPEADEMQGASLRPLWRSQLPQADRVAFTESAAMTFEIKSIRTERYKYMVLIPPDVVQRHGRGFLPPRGELAFRALYDLWVDPGEKQNLLSTPGTTVPAEEVKSLRRQLRQFVESSKGLAESAPMDEEMLKRLRALGYVK